VNPETLRNWVKQAKIDRGLGPVGALTTAEREESPDCAGGLLSSVAAAWILTVAPLQSPHRDRPRLRGHHRHRGHRREYWWRTFGQWSTSPGHASRRRALLACGSTRRSLHITGGRRALATRHGWGRQAGPPRQRPPAPATLRIALEQRVVATIVGVFSHDDPLITTW